MILLNRTGNRELEPNGTEPVELEQEPNSMEANWKSQNFRMSALTKQIVYKIMPKKSKFEV